MLVKPRVEDLLKKVDNRYELVIAISKRGREIIDGSKPMVEVSDDDKNELTEAAWELVDGKIDIIEPEGQDFE